VISKVLVANRGEIAIRAFRAAYELGIGTVAVYSYEDRNSLHRLKADESYQIGEVGHPVRAYLSVDEIVDTARRAGADAVYPGYGFLSENPELADACAAAGITFVGPSAAVLELTGNKSRAVAAAGDAELPVLVSSAPSASVAGCGGLTTSRRCPRPSSRPAAKPSRRLAIRRFISSRR
jgi:pyruvate carboxylase